MWKTLKNFIGRLQDSPEPVRRRWLVILSGASMAAVLGLWVLYINVIVDSAGSELALKPEKQEVQTGAVDAFVAGLKIVGQELKKGGTGVINRLREKLDETNSIEIRGNERNFILEGLEEIPATKLP